MIYNIFLLPSFLILFLIDPIGNLKTEYVEVKINDKTYNLEHANTKYKQALGLMLKDFKDTKGMLFSYNKPTNPTYYNKNVRFKLRIYFIDKEGNIKYTTIMEKDSFKLVGPKQKISYVVEIPLQDDLKNDPGENPIIRIN